MRRIPCPAHGGRDSNCSLWRDEHGQLRAKCWSHGCPQCDILVALGEPDRLRVEAAHALDGGHRTELARRIWRESRPARGSLVEVYLRSRGITLATPPSLRFHPSLRHPSGRYAPAMVAAVQSAAGGTVGVHRTFLKSDGSEKADLEPNKAMLGPCAGGAVRFAEAASTLAIAEGIETSLSISQACPDLAVWAALSTSGLRRLALPDRVYEVIICTDADPAGERAALAAAERFAQEGRRVKIARPNGTNDYNDLLLEAAT